MNEKPRARYRERARRRVSNENGSDTELTFTPSGPMMCTITRRSRYDFKHEKQSLTPRQTQILAAVRNHQSNKEIASCLDISESAVKKHITILLQKFRVDSRHKLKDAILNAVESSVTSALSPSGSASEPPPLIDNAHTRF